MQITLVNESTFEEAVSVYTASWQERTLVIFTYTHAIKEEDMEAGALDMQ
jgi:hypothetical protein